MPERPNGKTTTPAPPQGSSNEWAAYHLASAIRHLGDAIREGLLAVAAAVKVRNQSKE